MGEGGIRRKGGIRASLFSCTCILASGSRSPDSVIQVGEHEVDHGAGPVIPAPHPRPTTRARRLACSRRRFGAVDVVQPCRLLEIPARDADPSPTTKTGRGLLHLEREGFDVACMNVTSRVLKLASGAASARLCYTLKPAGLTSAPPRNIPGGAHSA